MGRISKASAILVIGLSIVNHLHAQSGSGSVSSNALVRQPIVLTGTRTLDFGIVFQGVSKTIAFDAATSGQFDASGSPNANVGISFTLPSTLASGASGLAIGTWTGCFNRVAANSSGPCTGFTPSGTSSNTTFGPAGRLFVFVGASVSPGAAQPPGVYVAPVTMTLTYF